jgi:hypothetical protein
LSAELGAICQRRGLAVPQFMSVEDRPLKPLLPAVSLSSAAERF